MTSLSVSASGKNAIGPIVSNLETRGGWDPGKCFLWNAEGSGSGAEIRAVESGAVAQVA